MRIDCKCPAIENRKTYKLENQNLHKEVKKMAEETNGIAEYAKKLVESVAYLGIAGLGFGLAVAIVKAVVTILPEV